MKLSFTPGSPFARKVRIIAIETGLIKDIELVTTVYGESNETTSQQQALGDQLPDVC